MESWYEKGRIAELIAQSCRVLGKLDMTYEAMGHVSYRLDNGETMLIKGKGVEEAALRHAAPRDVLEVDFSADPVVGPDGLRPPSESFIHTQIYKAIPDAQCVLHCHPRYPILMTLCDKPLLRVGGVGGRLAVQGVPTYPSSRLITTPELGDALVQSMGSAQVVLMRGHGIAVYGASVEDVTVRAIYLNDLAQFNYQAYTLGDVRPLDEEEMFREDGAGKTRGSVGGRTAMLAAWRYYCDRVGETAL